MTDIAVRLMCIPLEDVSDHMLVEAADEICRLRAELKEADEKLIKQGAATWELRGQLDAEHEQARKDVFYVADLLYEVKTLRAAMHDIYEVYAGSEGVLFPETCPEAYLYGLVMEMAQIAAKHKRAAALKGDGDE